MVTVEVYKYGERPHLTYQTHLLRSSGSEIVVRGDWGRPLTHYTRGLNLNIENQSVEMFWLDRPYTVSADADEAGSIRSYYCNINLPVRRDGDSIRYVDLDLDLWVYPDLTYKVLDEDEFEQHAVQYGYPPELVELAREGLAELIRVVESRCYPFDGTLEQLVREQFAAA